MNAWRTENAFFDFWHLPFFHLPTTKRPISTAFLVKKWQRLIASMIVASGNYGLLSLWQWTLDLHFLVTTPFESHSGSSTDECRSTRLCSKHGRSIWERRLRATCQSSLINERVSNGVLSSCVR